MRALTRIPTVASSRAWRWRKGSAERTRGLVKHREAGDSAIPLFEFTDGDSLNSEAGRGESGGRLGVAGRNHGPAVVDEDVGGERFGFGDRNDVKPLCAREGRQ